ncbi:hypothetical protein [Sphingosinicella sp. BN140058]|uniref:hypothetical protein n=1 Tax=Sphingosinicella sp. BN140058 TaxID=1892855 RepID=UPI0013ECEB2A|nr:hypothetical protein [Sphingosinicella sp. BN140058]
MTSVTFDQKRADALVHDIGQAILADANYVERDWSGIALVVEVGQRKRMYGYVYDAEGEWEAETPDDFDVIDHARALADVMAQGGSRWQRCLVQISRPGPKIDIRFDFDDSAEWVVTPGNSAEMAEKLRP